MDPNTQPISQTPSATMPPTTPVVIPAQAEIQSRKSFPLLPLILFLLFLGASAATAFLYLQNQSLQSQLASLTQLSVEVTPTPEITPTEDETANWKSYQFQQLYEIKIPQNLVIKTQTGGSVEIGEYLSLYVSTQNPEECRGACPITETTITKTINEIEMKYVTGWWGDSLGLAQSYVRYIIKHSNGKYLILEMRELPLSTKDIPPRSEVSKVSEDNIKLLDRILSTFKFIEPTTPISTQSASPS